VSDILYGDFEARSAVNLKAAGSWAWIMDASTEVLVFSFQLRGLIYTWHPGEPCPELIIEHAAKGGTFSGWNAGRFERIMWRHIMVPKFGWPELRDEQWQDPASRSRAIGLPGGLDNAAVALGLDVRKDKAGKDNMLRMAKPIKNQYFAVDEPAFDNEGLRFDLLDPYNRQDVRVEVAACSVLPPLAAGEREIELLDWRINDRGIAVDLGLVDALSVVTRAELHQLDLRMHEVTGKAVSACSALPKLKAWMAQQGVERKTLRKEDLSELLAEKHHPPAVQEALALRAEAGKSSVAKFNSMRQAVNADGRLRGMFLYHGAATGRWSGQVVQLQNMIRAQLPPDRLEEAVQLVFDAAWHGTNDRLRELADELDMTIMDLSSQLIRPCLVAAPGRLLQPGDLSQIEARMLPWLARADRLLEVYRQGKDPYVVAAAAIFRIPESEVTKQQRQIGKVAILALGYQGAVGAFNSMAAAYGVKLEEAEVLGIVQAWRYANWELKRFWRDLEDAAMAACREPYKEFPVGRVVLKHHKGNLYMRLPSGRWLTYWHAHVGEHTDRRTGYTRPGVCYKSAEGRGRLVDIDLYGGLLAENATQAAASDCLRAGLLNLEMCGLTIVGHVHDEAIVEVRSDQTSLIRQCMTEMPPWATGLPIACDVAAPAWRYGKG
jgi:DNA polymerase